MFTGIVEEIGIVNFVKFNDKSAKINISASKVLETTKQGDSISTNGICLTVTMLNKDSFEADIMSETMNRSNFFSLEKGSFVNLERAIRADGRFNGHMVSGHVDGVGVIESYVCDKNATWITVSAGYEILKYIVEKGSICINGVSLTVAYVDNICFKVSVIPHTGGETALLNNKIGALVNLECDVIGKYVEKILDFQKMEKKLNISESFLKNNGFY